MKTKNNTGVMTRPSLRDMASLTAYRDEFGQLVEALDDLASGVSRCVVQAGRAMSKIGECRGHLEQSGDAALLGNLAKAEEVAGVLRTSLASHIFTATLLQSLAS